MYLQFLLSCSNTNREKRGVIALCCGSFDCITQAGAAVSKVFDLFRVGLGHHSIEELTEPRQE
jgi:hypothetical protein